MKLLERVDPVCRRRGMSGRTAQVYGQWVRRLLAFSAAAHGRWVPPPAGGGYDVRQVQTLPGHASLKTKMVYLHVMNAPAVAVTSALDRLPGASGAAFASGAAGP